MGDRCDAAYIKTDKARLVTLQYITKVRSEAVPDPVCGGPSELEITSTRYSKRGRASHAPYFVVLT